MGFVIAIYLLVIMITVYHIIKYKKNIAIGKMKDWELKSIRITWEVLSTHVRFGGIYGPASRFFKLRLKNKAKSIYCSQAYPYNLTILVKEWDPIFVYLNKKNPHIYYIDDDFIVDKIGVLDDVYKTWFIRFMSALFLLLLLIVDIFLFTLGIQTEQLIDWFMFVWIWILILQLMTYLFRLIWANKTRLKYKKTTQ